jgi:hypothetical protein
LEQSVYNYNSGGACYFEVDAFLRKKGFYPHDIGEVLKAKHLFKTPGVGQFDILYVNPNAPRAPAYFKSRPNDFFCGQDRQLLEQPPQNNEPENFHTKSSTLCDPENEDASSAFSPIEESVLGSVEQVLSPYVKSRIRRRVVATALISFGFGFVCCFLLLQVIMRIRRSQKKE